VISPPAFIPTKEKIRRGDDWEILHPQLLIIKERDMNMKSKIKVKNNGDKGDRT